MKSIRLINETNIDSRALRRLIVAGLKAEGMAVPGYRVRVRWKRRGANVRGWGWYDSRSMILLPMKPGAAMTEMPRALVECMAHTLVHEVAHNRGLRHNEMDCGRSADEIAWLAPDMALPLRLPKAKPTKADRAVTRVENIDDRLAHWRRKLALAKTKVRKYEQAQKRAGVRLAALRAPPTPTP